MSPPRELRSCFSFLYEFLPSRLRHILLCLLYLQYHTSFLVYSCSTHFSFSLHRLHPRSPLPPHLCPSFFQYLTQTSIANGAQRLSRPRTSILVTYLFSLSRRRTSRLLLNPTMQGYSYQKKRGSVCVYYDSKSSLWCPSRMTTSSVLCSVLILSSAHHCHHHLHSLSPSSSF